MMILFNIFFCFCLEIGAVILKPEMRMECHPMIKEIKEKMEKKQKPKESQIVLPAINISN